MVSLVPPKRYWLWIIIGMLFTVLLSFVISFLAPFVVAALLVWLAPGPGGKLRKYFMFLFYLFGAFFVLIGVIIALGLTVAGLLGATANALGGLFTIVIGWIVGAIFVAIGLVLFVIGGFIAD